MTVRDYVQVLGGAVAHRAHRRGGRRCGVLLLVATDQDVSGDHQDRLRAPAQCGQCNERADHRRPLRPAGRPAQRRDRHQQPSRAAAHGSPGAHTGARARQLQSHRPGGDHQHHGSAQRGRRHQRHQQRAKMAQVAANAYAASFIAWRQQTEVGQIGSALAALKAQMATFTTTADQQSSNYLLLVQSAQSLAIRKATATGDFSVVVPASLPERAVYTEAATKRHPRLGRGPLRRHRPGLLAGAVRHALAGAGGGGAHPGLPHHRPHTAHPPGGRQTAAAHALRSRRAGGRGLPCAARQPRAFWP